MVTVKWLAGSASRLIRELAGFAGQACLFVASVLVCCYRCCCHYPYPTSHTSHLDGGGGDICRHLTCHISQRIWRGIMNSCFATTTTKTAALTRLSGTSFAQNIRVLPAHAVGAIITLLQACLVPGLHQMSRILRSHYFRLFHQKQKALTSDPLGSFCSGI